MLFRPGTSASSRSSATIDVSGKVFLRESLLEGPGDVSIVDVVCAESEERHTSNRDSIPAPEHQSEMPYESLIATRPSTERKKSKRQKVVGVLEKLKDKMGRRRHTTPPLKAANSGYCPGYVHRAVEELPEDDIEEDRCQWKVIQDIPTHAYKDLLLSLPFAQNMLDAYIHNSARGAYHYAVFIKTLNSKGKIEEFVVKLPGHGTPDRWTPEDGYMLDREAETMQLVHSKTYPFPRSWLGHQLSRIPSASHISSCAASPANLRRESGMTSLMTRPLLTRSPIPRPLRLRRSVSIFYDRWLKS